jgi:hypothetical protein
LNALNSCTEELAMAPADWLLLLALALLLVVVLVAWLNKCSELLPDIKGKAVLITGRREHY